MMSRLMTQNQWVPELNIGLAWLSEELLVFELVINGRLDW